MTRLGRIVSVGVIAIVAFAQAPAHAAKPAAGSISKAKRAVKWSGGPFNLSNPAVCTGPGDPTCDYYALKVNLGDGARIQVQVTTPSPNKAGGQQPVQGDDYDIYVYSPDGQTIAEGATEQGNEKLVFTHRARWKNKAYVVEVQPWAVIPGSTYTGNAKALTLGRR